MGGRNRPGKRERKQMTKSSDGEQTGPGATRKHWAKEAKEKAGALDKLLADLNCETVEGLRVALLAHAAKPGGPSAGDYAATVAAEPDFRPRTATEADRRPDPRPATPTPTDPLAWITPETPNVSIVSSIAVFGLVAAKDPRGKGAIDLANYTSEPWWACPFDFRHENRTEETNQRVMKRAWWFHNYRRELAEQVYAPGNRPVPKDAVIGAEDFTGWDNMTRAASGKRTPLTEFVPLREAVRHLLQRHTDTFVNWSRHKRDFPQTIPNPYRNRIDSMGGRILANVTEEQREREWNAAKR
jgi:hypothetical protein